MPYADKTKSRLAYKRWVEKHPEKHKEQVRIQKLAVYANPEVQVCSISGCNDNGERHHPDYGKPKEIIWLCKKHHELEHHNKKCIICGDKHRARGYCNKHWKKWRKGKL